MEPLQVIQDDKTTPNLFFDGFELQLNNAAVRVILKLGNNPLMMLRFSYVTGKTLLDGLAKIYTALEAVMGHQMLNTDQMNEKLQEVTALLSKQGATGIEGGVE